MYVLYVKKQVLSKSLEFIFGGDVAFYGPIDYHFKNGDCSYDRPFREMKGIFSQADFTMLNLETTLGNIKDIEGDSTIDKSIRFTSNPKALSSLT